MTTSIYARTENFINKSNKVHNFKYIYDRVEYKKSSEEVEIGCPTHGYFWLSPNKHSQGRGCKICSVSNRTKKQTKTESDFILECSILHSNIYTYPNLNYTTNKNRVNIECKEHGEFQQIAKDHTRGAGCPICARTKNRIGGYVAYNDATANDTYILYNIKISNKTETFYKYGVTNNFKQRYTQIKYESGHNYNIDIISLTVDTRRVCFLLEQKLLKKKRKRGLIYSPKIKFGGYTECYI